MKAILILLAGGASAMAGAAQAGSAGPVLATTGAPGGAGIAAESTCQSCHNNFPLNPDKAGKLVLTGVPAVYTPGQTYPLALEVSHPAATRWGFQATAIARSTFKGAGDFKPLANDRTTQRKAGSNGRVYIEHGGPGRLATGIGVKQAFAWKFNWVAPAAGVGEVMFYASANMANSDSSETGDKVYSSVGKPLAVSKGPAK